MVLLIIIILFQVNFTKCLDITWVTQKICGTFCTFAPAEHCAVYKDKFMNFSSHCVRATYNCHNGVRFAPVHSHYCYYWELFPKFTEELCDESCALTPYKQCTYNGRKFKTFYSYCERITYNCFYNENYTTMYDGPCIDIRTKVRKVRSKFMLCDTTCKNLYGRHCASNGIRFETFQTYCGRRDYNCMQSEEFYYLFDGSCYPDIESI